MTDENRKKHELRERKEAKPRVGSDKKVDRRAANREERKYRK